MDSANTNRSSLMYFCRRLLHFLSDINIYKQDDSISILEGKSATKIFITLFITSLFILVLFTSLSEQTVTVTISSPSLMTFEALVLAYPSTLICPCSRTSIPYGELLSFAPEYHQVCASSFIEQPWIQSLFISRIDQLHPIDFRVSASYQFQILAFLCRISNQTVSNAIEQLAVSEMFSIRAISRVTFDTEIMAVINQLQLNTKATMNKTDRFVSMSIILNRLVSALRTNFAFWSRDSNSGNIFGNTCNYPIGLNASYIPPSPINTTDSCYCVNSLDCSVPSGIYTSRSLWIPGALLWPTPTPIYFVPGMRTGCLPMNSMLQSTLECFYDDSNCLNILANLTGISSNLLPMNASESRSHGFVRIVPFVQFTTN